MVAFEDYAMPTASNVHEYPRHPSPAERRSRARSSWRGKNASTPSPEGHASADVLSSFPTPRPNKIFPEQLLEALSDPSSAGIIEWLKHGHAFAIKQLDRFAKVIMPKFTRGKLTSFQRQLNLYGFRKVTKGMDCKAGALVYFHPAFKRGRPEMMDGIKRIACKGDLSLNRLRNDEVPYNSTVPSEETEAPEQDVNALKIDTHKRSRDWRSEPAARKRARAPQYALGNPHDSACSQAQNGPRHPAFVMDEDAYLMGGIKHDMLASGLDAVMDSKNAMRPAAPPAVNFCDLPTRGTNYNFSAGAMNDMQRLYPKATVLPSYTIERSNPEVSTGVSSPSASLPDLVPLRTHDYAEEMLPPASKLPAFRISKPEPERAEIHESAQTEYYERAAKQLTMPPPKSRLTQLAVEDLMPIPLQAKTSGSVEFVSPNLSFAKPSGAGSGQAGSERLMRNVSEISGFSNASDLWRGLDELEKDMDFAGVFE